MGERVVGCFFNVKYISRFLWDFWLVGWLVGLVFFLLQLFLQTAYWAKLDSNGESRKTFLSFTKSCRGWSDCGLQRPFVFNFVSLFIKVKCKVSCISQSNTSHSEVSKQWDCSGVHPGTCAMWSHHNPAVEWALIRLAEDTVWATQMIFLGTNSQPWRGWSSGTMEMEIQQRTMPGAALGKKSCW